MRKILALCLTALMMLSIVAPVMAADETNVALGATVTVTGYLPEYAEKAAVLTDGDYNTDVDWSAGNWGGKHQAFATRYNANGETTELASYKEPPYTEGYPYYSLITLELKSAADLSKYRIIMADPDFGIGDYLIQEWDILVSSTGEAGSWKVAHEARQTKENELWFYDESEDVMYPYWVFEADLSGAENVKYVALGLCLLCNHNDLGKGQYVNMLELEVYGTAAGNAPATEAPATEAPATEAPATEPAATEAPATEAPATEAPATEAPATEPAATEPADAPDAPATFDFVIVPAIAIAAAAAGVVVLKKKEN